MAMLGKIAVMKTYNDEKVNIEERVLVDHTCSALRRDFAGRDTSADKGEACGARREDSQHQHDEGLPGRAGARDAPGGGRSQSRQSRQGCCTHLMRVRHVTEINYLYTVD